MPVDLDYGTVFPTGDEAGGLIACALCFAAAALWAFTQLMIHVYIQPRPLFSIPKVFHIVVLICSIGSFHRDVLEMKLM